MEQIEISRRITNAIDEINRIQNTLFALFATDFEKYPQIYETLTIDAALKAEDITCQIRNMVFQTTSLDKVDYMEKAIPFHNISIKEDDGILEITLPCLLPRKKQRQNKFLLEPFYSALVNYSVKNKTYYDHCVIYIRHVSIVKENSRDFDNIETKQIIDAIATFFLTDDSGKYCDVYNTVEQGNKVGTKIHLVPKTVFPEWLKSHRTTVQNISDFDRN